MLTKAHIDPSGMPSFFKKLATEYKDLDNAPVWLSSHPETLERIKLAEAYVAANPCKSCVPLIWDKTKILANLSENKPVEDKPAENKPKEKVK